MSKSFLIHLFYYTIFFPFVSILPIGSDLQPVFIIIMFFIIGLKFINFSKKDSFLLFIAISSLCYFNFFTYSLTPFKGVGAYLSIFISLFFLMVYEKVFNITIFISVLKKTIIIFFFSSILFYLFPNIFSLFQLNFVRAVNTLDDGIGYRGISTYFTEPGLFGAHMVGLLVLLIGLFNKGLIQIKTCLVYGLMILIMIILSKSGMGYLYLFFIVLYIIFINRKKTKIALPLIISFSVLSVYNLKSILEFNRGIGALMSLYDYNNITDLSILKRVYDFSLGFFILMEYPLGMGVNFTQSKVVSIINSSEFLNNFYNVNSDIGFVSSISIFFAYYGVLTVFLLIFLLKKYKPSLINVFYFFCFLSFSFSGAYPIIWVLLIQDYVLKNKIISN